MNRIFALLPHKTGAFLLTIFCFTSIASAQSAACPALVQRALDTTDQSCAATGGNEACYGNVQIEAQAAPDAETFDFAAPGDRVSLTQIQSLQLSSMVEPDEWGMALLRLQPRLANVLPGQNVTLVMFGNVKIDQQIDSAGDSGPMQAFFFRSGIGTTLCDEVPRDGLLIQTPKGLGQDLVYDQ